MQSKTEDFTHVRRDTTRELNQKWNTATGLEDGGKSPLATAIVQEAMEATEPHFDRADMATAVRAIANDCIAFASELTRK